MDVEGSRCKEDEAWRSSFNERKISCSGVYKLSAIVPPFEHLRVSSEAEIEKQSVVSASLRPHGLHSPWNSPGQNSGVGSRSLLQGIFPTHGPNPGLPHLQADSLPAEPLRSRGRWSFPVGDRWCPSKSGWTFTRKTEVGTGTSMIPWDCVKYLLTMVTGPVRLQRNLE